ncbi:MAG TPA: hypothetical protein VN239_01460 [Nitrososphaera sp.]|jgi:hypothetical protein|nr:hypothetical protein [Nitrososphaera sp.]
MIVIDSYMAMILPDDIAERILGFISGKVNFPFVGSDELMCIMYLFGRNSKIGEDEIGEVSSLAQHTASQLGQEIDVYMNSPANKLETEYIRSKYINRELQLAVERKPQDFKKRIAGDPAIISDCFAHHVAYYKQDYFLELYGPLRDSQITSDIRSALALRMVMVCYNRKGAQETRLAHPLIPVYVWFKDQAGAKP